MLLFHRTSDRLIGFYAIVLRVLYREFKSMDTKLKMVSEGKLKRRQTKKQTTLQGKLFLIWTQYEAGEISVNGLLKRSASLY